MSRRTACILAALVPFVVYSPTLLGTFYYDDNVVFFGHQVEVLAANPLLVFSKSTHYLPGAPRSVHVFFLLLIYKAFGATPFPFHLFNLAVHALTTLTVFALLSRFLKHTVPGEEGSENPVTLPALAGALLFGLHPVHVENITFVTLGGTDVFYALWALLSLLLYVWFRDGALKRKGPLNYGLLVLSALAYLLALQSKEAAVSFVLVYPLTELVILRRRGVLWALPMAGVLLAFKRDVLLSTAPKAIGAAVGIGATGGSELPEIIKNVGFFFKSLLLPWPHMPFIKELSPPGLFYAFAALLALAIVAAVVSRKRLPTFSALWFVLAGAPYFLSPTSGGNVAVTAERYVYVPSVALAVLGAAAVSAALGSRRLRAAALPGTAAVLILFSALGVFYFFSAWRSEEAFWRYAVSSNPQYVSGYVSLAGLAQDRGDTEGAKALLAEGLRKPRGLPAEFAQAAYSMGNIYMRGGDIKRAESYYLLSLRHSPYEFSFVQLGFLYLNARRFDSASRMFQDALRFRRQNAKALIGLAMTMDGLGRIEEAKHFAAQAFRYSRDERIKRAASGIIKGTAR